MWCCVNLMIILAVCVQQIYSAATLTDTTPGLDRECGKPLTLKCNITEITTCCTAPTRIWRKNTVVIMNFGSETTTSGKYTELVNNAENFFTLTINNFDDEDAGNEFICSYSVYTSDPFKPVEDFRCNPCTTCFLYCTLYLFVGVLIGHILLFVSYSTGFICCQACCYTRTYCGHKFEKPGDYTYKFYGKEFPNRLDKKRKLFYIVAGVDIAIVISYAVASTIFGLLCTNTDICYYSKGLYTLFFGFGIITCMSYFQWTFIWLYKKQEKKTRTTEAGEGSIPKEKKTRTTEAGEGSIPKDDTFSNRKYGVFMVLSYFIVPIPFLFLLYGLDKKQGGNNRSKESGSSCWPPCSVGPDPNSPDPENARSLLKKKADKKNEKKPVAVVRSQPPKNRHVKTDNTESTRYSAETEIFDEGVHKSAKPRPLPSIGQPSNSPSRPLPQMPPSSQLEKGGIQLEPLGDSTSEKKKKKRRKKKESKQSDEED